MSIQDLINRIDTARSNLREAGSQVSTQSTVYGNKPVPGDEDWFYFFESKPGGFKAAIGVLSVDEPETGLKQEAFSGELEGGRIEDDKGNTRYGVKGGAGAWRTKIDLASTAELFGITVPEDAVSEIDLKVASAAAEATVGEDGLTIGAQASVMEGGLNTGSSNGENETDQTIRRGGSLLGRGAAIRLHWDDADSNGFREFGGGFDAGPVSLDIKNEDPLRYALNTAFQTGGNPQGIYLALGDPKAPLDPHLPEGNLTESTVNLLGFSIKDENAPNA